jgi:hypothetical protein
MKQDRRGSWYLLTGAILGVALGLFYSWVISPVKYMDVPPYSLREDYKEQYRVLVAVAFLYNGDLLRAQDRLAQLKDNDAAQAISMQAQRAMAEGRPEEEIRALSLLASALSKGVIPAALQPTSGRDLILTPVSTGASPTLMISAPTISASATIQASETPTMTQQSPNP